MRKRIATADDPRKALIKAIALDIGKDTVAYVEYMYPQAVSATPSTFRMSLRNYIFNQIMAALEVTDEDKILKRLQVRAKHRREFKAFWKKNQETDWEAYRKKNSDKCPYYPGCVRGSGCTKCWENDDTQR